MIKQTLGCVLGLAGLIAFSNGYAFTPDSNSCQTYINAGLSEGNPNAAYFEANQPNIKACFSSCDDIYGTTVDKSTLDRIAVCKKSLSSLIFKGNYVMKLKSSGQGTTDTTYQAPPATSTPQDTTSKQQTIPSAPLKSTQPDLTKPKKKNNETIKWF